MHPVNKAHFWKRTILEAMPSIGDDVPQRMRPSWHAEQVMHILAALNGATPNRWAVIITAPGHLSEEEREIHRTTVLVSMLQDHILRDACPETIIFEAESWLLDHSRRCWYVRNY